MVKRGQGNLLTQLFWKSFLQSMVGRTLGVFSRVVQKMILFGSHRATQSLSVSFVESSILLIEENRLLDFDKVSPAEKIRSLRDWNKIENLKRFMNTNLNRLESSGDDFLFLFDLIACTCGQVISPPSSPSPSPITITNDHHQSPITIIITSNTCVGGHPEGSELHIAQL